MHVLRKLVSEHMDEQAGSLRKSVGTVQQAMTGWARMNKPAKIELGKTPTRNPLQRPIWSGFSCIEVRGDCRGANLTSRQNRPSF